MSAPDDLTRLVTRGGPILLDFDGPICDIFAGYSAPAIAAELVDELRRRVVTVPHELASETDPLQVLRWAGAHARRPDVERVEDALCAAELRAVASSRPTPYAREVIVAARQAGLPVAIVSNNSAGAVAAYLAHHRLLTYVSPIIGRAYADPAQMKPNPEPVNRAVFALGAKPDDCLLVGDSLTDIEAARAAGVPVIGYANKPSKVSRFAKAGADAVVTTMSAIASALLSLTD